MSAINMKRLGYADALKSQSAEHNYRLPNYLLNKAVQQRLTPLPRY